MFASLIVAAAIAAPAPAAAPQQPVTATKIDLAGRSVSCPSAQPDEVMVCGERRGAKYRIDPAVLAVQRSREPALPERQPDYIAVTDQSCVPHGTNGCPGADAIPVLRIALVVAEAGLLALMGEDWREPLRTTPDAYRLHRETKAKTAKQRVSIHLGGAPVPPRPGH